MAHNKAIKFAPFGRRTFVPHAVYGGRYESKLPTEITKYQ